MQNDFSHPRDQGGERQDLQYSPTSFGAEDDNWIDAGGDAQIDRLESDNADDDSDERELEIIDEGHSAPVLATEAQRINQDGSNTGSTLSFMFFIFSVRL